MHPIVCQIGPFTIFSYGLMLALAFIAGSTLAASYAGKHGIEPEIIFNLSFVAVVSGIVGARIFYVLENPAYYFNNPLEVVMLSRGGLSWFGGLILSSISAILFLKKRNLPVYKLLDLMIPFVALAQAIGRIGCLLNGCCFGLESKFGLFFPAHKSVLIPTQAYSSLALLFIYIILRFLQERPHKEGDIFFAYLILYSIKRFFIEYWRADNAVVFFGFTLFQCLSVAIFLFAAWRLSHRGPRRP